MVNSGIQSPSRQVEIEIEHPEKRKEKKPGGLS